MASLHFNLFHTISTNALQLLVLDSNEAGKSVNVLWYSDMREAFRIETEAPTHETEARRRDASRRPLDRTTDRGRGHIPALVTVIEKTYKLQPQPRLTC